jgi:hypothetical protein
MSILVNPLVSNKDAEAMLNDTMPMMDFEVEHVIAGPGAFCIYPVLEVSYFAFFIREIPAR